MILNPRIPRLSGALGDRQGHPKKTGLYSMPTWWPGSLQSNVHRPISVEETGYKEIPIWILAGFSGVWGRL